MNWSKIKTIMIYFLIVMNIFIISFIAITSSREVSVSDEVIQSTVKVLKNDGFSCKKEIIPTTSYNLPVLNTVFYSASDLSEIFFNKQLAFRTSGNSLEASDGTSTLKVAGNFFTFESHGKADLSASPRRIKLALKKAGINMDNAVYDKKERCFYRMYKGINLFNMYIKAELDEDGKLCEISAIWPGKLTPYEKKNLSFVSSVKKVKETFPDGGNISIIEEGYSLVPLGNEKYLFTPAWRVMVEDELEIIE